MAPLTITCPVCGQLLGWNRVVTAEGGHVLVRHELDDLSRRRHRACAITPKGTPKDTA